jgi:large subunit ribosomal protein L34
MQLKFSRQIRRKLFLESTDFNSGSNLDTTLEAVMMRPGVALRSSGRAKCTMQPTYRPSKIRRKRRFGFLKRAHTKSGRATLRRRRRKGRKRLSPV